MSYKPGDKLVLEIEKIADIYGGMQHYQIKDVTVLFAGSMLSKLDRLDSDYINEHYGELQDEAYAKGREDGFNDGKETGYFEGVNMAWDLARRLFLSACDGVENALSDRDLNEIFETRDVAYIVNRYVPDEIASRIEAWEKAKEEIKVGDVVEEVSGGTYLVVKIDDDEWCRVLTQRGDGRTLFKKNLTKTGRSIDIQSILEQIGETA